ncbi:MAG: PHB depolymerase family esterase, partial [Burkholderiaceae bacterium]|nr:PHB depolymerase family esterase [Burkholderiaceae bacterium]
GEAALILKAIDQLGLRQPVDLARVAVVGLSAGASMAALLAARHPERFKAAVMHSGVPVGAAHNSLSALAAMGGRRVAKPLQNGPGIGSASLPHLLVIQGEADPLVVPANGRVAAESWAAASLASAGPVRTMQRGQRYPFSLTEYKHAGEVVVAWIEVARLGHAWSGGAPKRAFSDPQGPDASRMLWQFVAKRFRG